nr:uncharacterized protein LOC111999508 [Quercus suber]
MKSTLEPISFDDSDLEGTIQPYDDAMIVAARVGGFRVKRIMIDQGSGADIMYSDLFKGLWLRNMDLSKYSTPLVGFDGKVVVPKGQISLAMNMEGKEVVVMFIVVASFSPYTAILERSLIHVMGAVPSTLHVKVKFPTNPSITMEKGTGCTKRMVKVKVLPDVDKYFQIGEGLKDQDKVEMLLLLIQNVDVFAWSPYEVPGVDPEFIVHRLNIDPTFPPKKQRPRSLAKEHVEAVKAKVQRLKEAGVIREIYFPEWLANTVLVRKKNGKWRITLTPKDQEKTAFISLDANYHYTVMPFGLKNARATYERIMTRMFRDKIGRMIEVYIDDMVVKSKQEEQHVEDLRGVFEIEAVKCLKPPSNPKEVQVLIGMLAALNRFISKFADCCRPFYQLLKKWNGFQWNEECDKAFRDLKEYLM